MKIKNEYGVKDNYVVEALDEVFITYTTLLVMLDRVNEAREYLDKALLICEHYDLERAKGRILIMQVSIQIKYY